MYGSLLLDVGNRQWIMGCDAGHEFICSLSLSNQYFFLNAEAPSPVVHKVIGELIRTDVSKVNHINPQEGKENPGAKIPAPRLKHDLQKACRMSEFAAVSVLPGGDFMFRVNCISVHIMFPIKTNLK